MTASSRQMITRHLKIHVRIWVGVVLILTSLLTPLTAQADSVIRVAPSGSADSGCGDTWSNACSLDYALSQAGSGREIWVMAGTYVTQSKDAPFVIPSEAAVYGGFAGIEANRDERNWYRHPTILSGDIQQNDQSNGDNRADNSYHVVLIVDSSSTTRLDGFVIEGGSANGSDSNGYGGGVLVQHGSPTLENLVLQSNSADYGGGIACTDNSSLAWLINVRFERNIATYGGGLYSSSSSIPVIEGAAFSANQAETGGAIHSHGIIEVGNASISGNTASRRGGGIYAEDFALILLNSIVWGNHQGQASDQIYTESTSFIYNAIIEGGFDGYSIRDVDPAFMNNPTSGPDGRWGTYDDTPGFLDLRYTSPAIDKGQESIYPAQRMTRDLKNWPRHIDHPRPDTPAGDFLDLGGYEAGVIHVQTEGAGTADGSSWQDAYPELRDALQAAQHNEIWVAAGTYRPGASRTDTFALKSDVGIYGGFAGDETLLNQRNWAAHAAILSGDLPGGNVYHVVSGLGVDSTAVLDGFTIQDGNANGANPPLNHGGGIYLENAAPLLANLVVTNNQATVGGGLYGLSSNYQLSQSTFIRNQASYGGGIYQTGTSQPILKNILFTGNRAVNYGGALFNDGDTAADFSNIVMAGNQAATAGGIFNSNNSQPIFRNITLAGNPGGAIHNFASSQQGTARFINMIAWDNGPQPIVVYRGNLVIRRSLVEYGCFGLMDCDYVMTTDPHLARLPGLGTDGQWGTADDDYGDLRLAPHSQAIDAGDNSAVLPDITVDFAGSPRFVDDPDVLDTGIGTPPQVDIGAYEANRGETITTIDLVKPAASVVGQSVTIDFHVAGGQTTPTGRVTVTSAGGSCFAPANQGSCSITFQHSGDYNLKAVFAGDGVNNGSESTQVAQHVDPADTLVNLQLSPNPAAPGQVIHATFKVAPLAPGAGQPTGSVQVGTPPFSCTATLQQGGCDLPLADTGAYSFIATYSGDADFKSSPSLPVALQISPTATTTQILSIDPSPSMVSQAVTVHFQVTASTGMPAGTVTVSDGQNECSAAATTGECTLTFDTIGVHTLIASYQDAYAPASSISAPVTHQVTPLSVILTLSVPKSTGLAVGEPFRAEVTLQSPIPGMVIPASRVEIGDGTTACSVQAGASGCDLVFDRSGMYTLRAYYQGSAPFGDSVSTPITVRVGNIYFLPILAR